MAELYRSQTNSSVCHPWTIWSQKCQWSRFHWQGQRLRWLCFLLYHEFCASYRVKIKVKVWLRCRRTVSLASSFLQLFDGGLPRRLGYYAWFFHGEWRNGVRKVCSILEKNKRCNVWRLFWMPTHSFSFQNIQAEKSYGAINPARATQEWCSDNRLAYTTKSQGLSRRHSISKWYSEFRSS